MKTAKLRDEKEVLDRQQHADIEAQKNLEENFQQLSNREHELNAQEEQMRMRQKNVMETSARHKEELMELKKELRLMQDKHRDCRFLNSMVYFMKFVLLIYSHRFTNLFCCMSLYNYMPY